MDLPRILVLIGSGETAAQMTRGHRMLVKRIVGERGRPRDVQAVILDTPYRFQENAADLSADLLDYFGRRIGMNAEVAAYGRSDEGAVVRETAYRRIREAQFVFSGPGSPSYALRQWSKSSIPDLLTKKLASGGVLVFASAAALTMGRVTVPVYEIYKAGEDPFWLTGMDLLGTIGIGAAVVPHFDNREGGDHDTRFCFLGERRLRTLEEQLPAGTYVLGIDEHTALMLDLDSGRALVHGRGSVTVREHGRGTAFPAGTELPIADLQRSGSSRPVVTEREPDEEEPANLARRVVELERLLAAERSRAGLVEPALSALLEMRQAARSVGDYAAADLIRERLAALGVELTDSADGTTSYSLPD